MAAPRLIIRTKHLPYSVIVSKQNHIRVLCTLVTLHMLISVCSWEYGPIRMLVS